MNTRLLLPWILLAACASVPDATDLGAVPRIAAERGVQGLVRRSAGEDPEIQRRIDELLAAELTPESAVAIALLRSPRLQAVYEDLSVAQSDLVQAGLLRNPAVSMQFLWPVGSGTSGSELSMSRDVVQLFQMPLRKRLAGAALRAAELRVAGEVLDLIAGTRAAFHELQAAAQQHELQASVTEALAAAYELARRRHAAGNLSDYHLAIEQTELEQRRLALAAAEVRVQVARTRLDVQLGTSGAATAWRFAPRLPELPADELELEHVESRAIARSLELAVLQEELAIAGGRLGLTRTFRFLPGLQLGVGAEREDREWSVGPSLGLPLPLFDQGQARIAAAEAAQRRLREQRTQVAVEIRAAARALRTQLISARQRVQHSVRVVLPLRRRIVAEAQRHYNAMQIAAFELVAARRAEIEAGALLVAELQQYWATRTELERLLDGRLGWSPGPARDQEPPAAPAAPSAGH